MLEAFFPYSELVGSTVLAIFSVFLNPLFWGIILLIGFQYRRIAQVRDSFLGASGNSVVHDTLIALAYGVVGGLAGGFLIVFAGVALSFEESGLFYLLPVAVLLMLINPRFLCFAYAGGLLAVSNLLFGFPEVSIPQVMALVAVLHFVESILIYLSGHLGAVPSFVRLPSGQIVGGFTLQKFWPIPIVILVLVNGLGGSGEMGTLAMPEWWPLIRPAVPEAELTAVYALLPLAAGLGYADIATSRTPSAKSRISALYLAVYSVLLFVLAVFAGWYGIWFSWAAALFAPLGHELIISISRFLELRGEPLFKPQPQGLMVLDVVTGSPAWDAGLRSGDTILDINSYPVNSKWDLRIVLNEPGIKEINFVREQRQYQRGIARLGEGKSFGIMPVPEGNEEIYIDLPGLPSLKRFLGKGRNV